MFTFYSVLININSEMTLATLIPVLFSAASSGSKYYCYDGFQPYIDAQNTPKLSKNATVAVVKTTVAAMTTEVFASSTEVFVEPTSVVDASTKVVIEPTWLPSQQPGFSSRQLWLLSFRPRLLSPRPRLSAQQLWHIWLQDSIFYFQKVFLSKEISTSIYKNQFLFTNSKIKLRCLT